MRLPCLRRTNQYVTSPRPSDQCASLFAYAGKGRRNSHYATVQYGKEVPMAICRLDDAPASDFQCRLFGDRGRVPLVDKNERGTHRCVSRFSRFAWFANALIDRSASGESSLSTSRRSRRGASCAAPRRSPNSIPRLSRKSTTGSPLPVLACHTSLTVRADHCPPGEHQPGVMHRRATGLPSSSDSITSTRSVSHAMQSVRLKDASPSNTSRVSTNQGMCMASSTIRQCCVAEILRIVARDSSSWRSVMNMGDARFDIEAARI